MPTADTHVSEIMTDAILKSANGFVAGTTFPEKVAIRQEEHSTPPTTIDGPQINGTPTTLTLFSPTQLAVSPLLPSLIKVINDAFRSVEQKKGVKGIPLERLRGNSQLFDELGSAPGTFTYVISYTGTHDVVATASGKRYLGEVAIVKPPEVSSLDVAKTFKRFGLVAEGTEAWELSTMAVDPGLQRQGLAGYLTELTENEIKQCFDATKKEHCKSKLLILLTTTKEINGEYYEKRGFALDYETAYPRGHLGVKTGFTVAHMSREAKLDEQQRWPCPSYIVDETR